MSSSSSNPWRARASTALRWLAPSAAAGGAAGVAAGGLAAWGGPAPVTTAGVVALVVAPLAIAASVGVRGVLAAWAPGRLAEALREDGGGMPRLAGWVGAIGLGALVLGWTMFQATWGLAAATAFKPLVVGYAQAVVAVATTVGVIAGAPPLARLLAAGARRLDARWRRRGRRTLLTPAIIFTAAAVASLGLGYGVHRLLVRPRIGPLPLAPAWAPLAGALALCAVHAAWRRLGRARAIAGAGLTLAAAALIAIALHAAWTAPGRVLAIYGRGGLPGLAASRALDLEAVRGRLPRAAVRPAARAGAAHPDIVLVTLASARADHAPPYGGAAAMPVLRDLARTGALFRAYAPATTPWPALPAIALGRPVDRVHLARGAPARLDPRHVTLPERLRAAGYATAAFTCCPELWGAAAATGLHRGLDHHAAPGDDAARARAFAAWLAGAPAAPLFAWIHLDGPARWQDAAAPPRTDAERVARYDAALADADQRLGVIVAALADRPHPAIVIVAGVHGEALGDHGQVGHGTDLHDAQLRVPLVIAGPGVTARVVAEPVSTVSLPATILDLAGLVPPVGAADPPGAGLALTLEGPSLAPLATGARRPDPDAGLALAHLPRSAAHPAGLTAIIRGKWKLIDAGTTTELYDLVADPQERTNQAAVRSDAVVPLRRALEQRDPPRVWRP